MSRALRLAALIALTAAMFALSLMAGKQWIPLNAWHSGDPRWAIIAELRVPRALLGLVLGGSLGLSGAVLQGYLRNPLADPTGLGVSSSAAMGAVAAIVLSPIADVAGGALGQFGWAMGAAMGAMVLLSFLTLRATPVMFVLAGTVLASLAGALTVFLISIAPDPYAVAEAIDWLMGALTDRGTEDLMLAVPFVAVGTLLLLFTGPALDALALGEDAATSLGTNLTRLRWLVVIGTGLAVGADVAVTGVVGFIGLVVPHLLRPVFGAKPSALLVPSLFGGAALTLAADSFCRLAPGAGEVRLGVVTAMIGAPFFLWLLFREGGRSWR